MGKNNLQNDKLTSTAEPNEWWLHAKDMPGSHVIVLSADPDEETLHMAARLAARYSKGASAGKVPIDMTRRRYVKKPAGAKPGFVIYTNQKTGSPSRGRGRGALNERYAGRKDNGDHHAGTDHGRHVEMLSGGSGRTAWLKELRRTGAEYMDRYKASTIAAKELIKQQLLKCSASGFITGFGGLLTLPVTVPANVASVLYVQMRMIAALAAIGGYDVHQR